MVKNKFIGYKVAIIRGKTLFSLMMHEFKIGMARIGNIARFEKFYLATSKEYALSYSSSYTSENEMFLTYEYKENDIVEGNSPNDPYGEIIVNKAILVDMREIIKDENNDVINYEELLANNE